LYSEHYPEKIIIDNYLEDSSGLFAIFDGHGGSQVSEYCANVIPNVTEKIHRYSNRSMPKKKIT
jgi:serine/threonine protein phosphatase PrpC